MTVGGALVELTERDALGGVVQRNPVCVLRAPGAEDLAQRLFLPVTLCAVKICVNFGESSTPSIMACLCVGLACALSRFLALASRSAGKSSNGLPPKSKSASVHNRQSTHRTHAAARPCPPSR
jgi:hypothetical protein